MALSAKDFFDLQVPFFIPLWRRIAVVAVSLGWSVVEFTAEAHFWGFVFAGLGVFAAWQLLLSGWPNDESLE